MSTLSVSPPYPIITGADGQPLEDGYVWIGAANLNPITNPIAVYWDAALTQPAGQPVRTRGSYPVNAGTPARLYVDSDYSILVQNKNGSTLYSAPDGASDRFSAAQIEFLQAGAGAVVRTAQSKMRDVVSVLDFGADPTGVVDSYPAFAAALAASNNVFVPAGTYKIGTQISITGNKTITGPDGGTQAQQVAVINFTGISGSVFSATSAEFGGVCIRNLSITGGNGSYAIRSSRPQSLFENILMEGYVGGGIQLFEAGTGSQASWGCAIKNIKWVGPTTPSNYRGIDITQNGGHLLLENCTALYGAIGININQGEAIDIVRCSLNQQGTYSSAAATDTASIRLSGAGYKKAIAIRECYIEGYKHGIYVEKCESLTIEDNYMADLGQSSNYGSIWLKDDATGGLVNNVTIRNNHISDQGDDMSSVYIGDRATNVVVLNNYISCTGGPGPSTCIKKGSVTMSYVDGNTLFRNPAIGNFYVDPYGLLSFFLTAPRLSSITFPATQVPSADTNTLDDYQEGTWTPTISSMTNISGVTVTKATYTKIGRQVSLQIAGDLSITSATTLSSFVFTLPENTGDLNDPAYGSAMLDFTGVGGVTDASGGSADTAYVFFPANQVLGTGTQVFRAALTYNAA